MRLLMENPVEWLCCILWTDWTKIQDTAIMMSYPPHNRYTWERNQFVLSCAQKIIIIWVSIIIIHTAIVIKSSSLYTICMYIAHRTKESVPKETLLHYILLYRRYLADCGTQYKIKHHNKNSYNFVVIVVGWWSWSWIANTRQQKRNNVKKREGDEKLFENYYPEHGKLSIKGGRALTTIKL